MTGLAEGQMEDDRRGLLEAAEGWSEEEREERYQQLLDHIHAALADHDTCLDLRMDCVQWLAQRLAKFVPVYEAEENIYSPLLSGILAFLDQVFQTMDRTEELNKVSLMSVATALLDHADAVVLQAGAYDGLGPGEIPSLPRLVPKLLLNTFKYCVEEREEGAEMPPPLLQLFCRARVLLHNFLGLMESMRIRTVLEDEKDIVLELCADLVGFHKLLTTFDLKSSLKVWQLYGKLAREHADRLRSKLDVEMALVILLQEGVKNFEKLESYLPDNDEDTDHAKEISRSVVTLTAVAKIILGISDCYRNMVTRELATYLEFVRRLLAKGRTILPRLGQQQRQLVDRLNRDLYTPALLHNITTRVVDEVALSRHLTSVEKRRGDAFLHIYLMMSLLEQDPALGLLDTLLQTFGYCILDIHRAPDLEGLEVPGCGSQLVDSYEWVLTRLCSLVSSASPSTFLVVEEALLRNILKTNSLTCQLTCDLWCFIARYGSSQLCLSHLVLLSSLYGQLDPSVFSVQRFWLAALIGRLFSFLSAAERRAWAERFPPDENNNLDLWTLVYLSLVKANAESSMQPLADIVQAHLTVVLAGEGDYEYEVSRLASALRLLCRLTADSPGSSSIGGLNPAALVLTAWQKLAEGEFVSSPSVWLAEVLSALGELTSSLVAQLPRVELYQLLASLRVMASNGLMSGKENNFFVQASLGVLSAVANLDWIGNVDDVESCLVEELANLCGICLRLAVREPLLKVPGLLLLRQIAETSNNAAFIRLCADEEEVMPHFELFLKQDGKSRDSVHLSCLDVFEGTEDLGAVVNDFCCHSPESEVKRKVSQPSLSPKRKKHKVDAEPDDADPGGVAELIDRLEVYADRLFEAFVVEKESLLTEENAQRLVAVRHKISALLPQQFQE